MKIVFLDRKTLGQDIGLEQFEQFGEVIIYQSTKHTETLQRIQDADIVITNKVVIDKALMDQSNIQLICIAATGMNNIDLEYAKTKNITVKNVAGYSSASVAQLTISMALEFIQNTHLCDKYGKTSWQFSDIFTNLDYPFWELEGKKWGIIGLGDIGKRVAKVAEAFGCEVSYFSTSGKNKNNTYSQKNLDELLETSDVITIHAPLNEQTNNLLNRSNMKNIKDGAILLNLGRGGIVNEQDIAEVLNNDQNIYYGTDVVSKEPIESSSPLLTIKDTTRLIITPHIAWASKESRIRLLNGIEKNITEFLN